MGEACFTEGSREKSCVLASPVEIPDALCLELLAREGVGGPEVAQQAQRAVARNLPDAEEA